MNKQIIQEVLGHYYKPNQKYHSQLPQELREWYAYTTDGGHNILCLLKKKYQPNIDLKQQLIPIPVKTVLKDYETLNGCIIVDCKYSSEIGLIFDKGDEEF